MSAFNLLSDHHYRFRKDRPIGGLPFLFNSSSSLICFGDSFDVALDMSKTSDRVRHNLQFIVVLATLLWTSSLVLYFYAFWALYVDNSGGSLLYS